MKRAASHWGVGLALIFVSLAAPAAAGAVTYCVHQSGSCPVGETDEGSNLQLALNHAGENPGSTVAIGAGTFTRNEGFNSVHPGVDVTIAGAGAGQTVLASTVAKPAPGYVFSVFASASSTLSGLTVHVRSSDGGGLSLSTATASAISVETDKGGPGNQSALVPSGGATIEHSTIQGETDAGCCPAAIFDSSGQATTLIDDTLIGYFGIYVIGASTNLTARDVRLSGPLGILVIEGNATVDGMLGVFVPPPSGAALETYEGGSLTVRSATVVGTNATGSKGLLSFAAGGASALTFNDSIVRDFPIAYEQRIDGSGGTAKLTVDNDDLPATHEIDLAESIEENNDTSADPLFVDPPAGDYHLRFGSPAIDSGNACNAICQAVPDLDGLTRPIDGNGDGTATRDMGAYEYGHRAPSVSGTLSTAPHGAGQSASLSATASDPDPGDAVSLAWSFDDGTSAVGAAVSHAFAKAGTHIATVTATDSSGLSASATVTVKVPAAETKITKAKIDAGTGKATFHFRASAGTARSYQCELRRRHAKKQPKFSKCKSPKTYRHLGPGSYTFEVRALESSGTEKTPAKRTFTLH